MVTSPGPPSATVQECSALFTVPTGVMTAAVITPVGTVKSAEHSWTVGTGEPGPVTMQLREALLDIQTGRAEDAHGWMHTLVGAH